MGRGVNVSKAPLGGGIKRVEGIEEIQVHVEGERETICPLPGIDEFHSSIPLQSGIFV